MRVLPALIELVDSFKHPHEYSFAPNVPYPRLKYLQNYLRCQMTAYWGPMEPATSNERLTVILLSYKRMRNMDLMVRSALQGSFVERVIVSNNNPEVRIRDWVEQQDERLILLDQPVARRCGFRYTIARQYPARYYVSIDDDLFLTPRQLQLVFDRMRAKPDVPHGVQGQRWLDEQSRIKNQRALRADGWVSGVRGDNLAVDCLNRLYAFTDRHVDEIFRLAGLLGIDMLTFHNGEDLLLSFCGNTRPLVHDVGEVGNCLSSSRVGVATYTSTPGFHQERTELLFRVRALKPEIHPESIPPQARAG